LLRQMTRADFGGALTLEVAGQDNHQTVRDGARRRLISSSVLSRLSGRSRRFGGNRVRLRVGSAVLLVLVGYH
jgi:hypothetical protein